MQSGALLCFFHQFNNRCVPIGKIINLPQPIYDCLVYMSPCSVSSTSEDKCTTPADNQQMLHFYIYIYLYINDFCGSQALDYYMYFIGLKINTIRAQCEFYVMRIFSQTRYWQDIYSREIKIPSMCPEEVDAITSFLAKMSVHIEHFSSAFNHNVYICCYITIWFRKKNLIMLWYLTKSYKVTKCWLWSVS